ncbi:hypothetical protein GX51_07454 [Blastomyces parvus]|uniref:Uncharacterized protein n=1 Tax=Blastomyces parvus TaxID=2060905 RepID=A0A2B7WKZ5_9EURO|nr:hypothetical protein GX51_07454 [Blastomyces parvus]
MAGQNQRVNPSNSPRSDPWQAMHPDFPPLEGILRKWAEWHNQGGWEPEGKAVVLNGRAGAEQWQRAKLQQIIDPRLRQANTTLQGMVGSSSAGLILSGEGLASEAPNVRDQTVHGDFFWATNKHVQSWSALRK